MVQSKLRPKSSLESRPKLEILGGATKEEWGRKRSFLLHLHVLAIRPPLHSLWLGSLCHIASQCAISCRWHLASCCVHNAINWNFDTHPLENKNYSLPLLIPSMYINVLASTQAILKCVWNDSFTNKPRVEVLGTSILCMNCPNFTRRWDWTMCSKDRHHFRFNS
jgi:hypothetical protein